jgi:PIN domain nuclease of toxin-antitoxin system
VPAAVEVSVLDASALVAVALREPGGEVIVPLLRRARVNAVNLAEVLIALERRGVRRSVASALLDELPFETVAADESLVPHIAEVHRASRRRGLSLADCICLATGRALGATVYTADRAWAKLDVGTRVEVIR